MGGNIAEKPDMLDMLHTVYDKKPWVTPPHNCSWAGENCLHTGCCADSCVSNFEWTRCEWYTCYKRDEYFAGCMLGGAEFDWDGHKFEGHPNYEVGPVAEGKLVQGTRLYCFSVVMWNLGPAEGWMNSEAELANNWLNQKKGICQCEILLPRSWECEVHLGQEGGEDYWLEQCLEGLGIDYQTDTGLLHDKYAADENCGDPNFVAGHFFKKVDTWDTCWNIANGAWNNAHPE